MDSFVNTRELPKQFTHNISHSFGDEGRAWLARLDAELAWCAEHWQLELGEPFELSYNYVTAARQHDGTEVVLKLCVPSYEWQHEVAALRAFHGVGVAQLLDVNADHAAFMLERLQPGTMLSELHDDDQRTTIALEIMRQLWHTPPTVHAFPHVQDWASGLDKVRQHFPDHLPFDSYLLDMAQRTFADLFASYAQAMLLHGDLHHFNILRSGETWKLIDPKGIIGEPAFDLAAFLLNPNNELPHHADLERLFRRRIAMLSDGLGIDRQRITHYAAAFAVLSAWWDMDEHGHGGEQQLRYAEILSGL